jgi:histidine triad (HIT) family protein
MYDDKNIFARIIAGEIPCDKVYDDENTIAFKDISPAAPIHILVLPKGKYISYDDFITKAPSEIIHKFFQAVQKIAADLNLTKSGYRIITNHGDNAGQSVPHFHIHILGGQTLGPLIAAGNK